MPWTCKTCSSDVPLDVMTCPGCEAPKTAWTVIQDKTRTLVVTRKKVDLLRGLESAPATPGPLPEALEPTTVARVLPWLKAAAYAKADQLPPTAQLLYVRLTPQKHKELTVGLSLNFETRRMTSLEVEPEARDGQDRPVASFLFVHKPPVGLTLRLNIDPKAKASTDDRFTLRSSDGGGYEEVRTVADDVCDHDDYTDVVYHGLNARGRYSLEIDPGADGEPYFLFEDASYLERAGLTPEDYPEELIFPGVQVVELTEEPTEDGPAFAPCIEVEALGRPTKELPTGPPSLLINPRWGQTKARTGDTVELIVDAPEVADGEVVAFKVLEFDEDQKHDLVAELSGEVQGGQVQASWAYEAVEDTDDVAGEGDTGDFTLPEYVFEATLGPDTVTCYDLLQFSDELAILFRDAEGNLLRGVECILRCGGRERRVVTGDDGFLRESGIPPAPVSVSLADGRTFEFV